MSLADAQNRVGYTIRLPSDLGEPDEVYLRRVAAGKWLPCSISRARGYQKRGNRRGSVLMQFPADAPVGDISKRISQGMASMLDVAINGNPGFWISGETELVNDQKFVCWLAGSGSAFGQRVDLGSRRDDLSPGNCIDHVR